MKMVSSRSKSRKGNMHKAQVAMEYIIVVGFVIAISIPTILIFYDYSKKSQYSVILTQADNAAEKIAEAVDMMSYYDEPSKIKIEVMFPKNVRLVNISHNEIYLRVGTYSGVSDVTKFVQTNVTGTLGTWPGIHIVTIESKGSYVLVSDNE